MAINKNWTDAENDFIVADYFAMLEAELTGRAYNKSEHRRQLLKQISRSESSIEFKHRNISGVLKGLGERWIKGYRPAFNFQESLEDAVNRWLQNNEDFHDVALLGRKTAGSWMSELAMGPPPSLRNVPPPKELERMQRIARKFDVAGRDERNRALGRAGEERVVAHERASLKNADRADLAKLVRWVSEEDGDGAGYDIESYSPDGGPRLIEVKTTNGWERTPFYITRNELAVANERSSEWHLVRLYDFSREPRAFELRPPLEAHVSLIAANYEARFDRSE